MLKHVQSNLPQAIATLIWGALLATGLWATYMLQNLNLRNDYFGEASPQYLVHSLGMLIISIMLLWIIYFIGASVNQFGFKKSQLEPSDWILLGFFNGMSVVYFGMFVLGASRLYQDRLITGIFVALLLLSYRKFTKIIISMIRQTPFNLNFSRREFWMVGVAVGICWLLGLVLMPVIDPQAVLRTKYSFLERDRLTLYGMGILVLWLMLRVWGYRYRIPTSILAGLLFGLLIVIFANKVVLPTRDTDSTTHYLPYMREVIKNGHIYPNSAWYQYFYSKGVGLDYLAMILTNDEGYGIAAFTTMIIGLVAIYAISRSITQSNWLAMACVIYVVGHVVLPELTPFAKHHALLMFLLPGLFWMLSKLYTDEARHIWFVSAMMLIITITMIASIMAVLLGFFFGLLLIVAYVQNPHLTNQLNRYLFFLGLTTVLAYGGNMIFNYFVIGLYDITPFRTFTQFANISRFAETFSPNTLYLLWDLHSPSMGTIDPFAGLDLKGTLFLENLYVDNWGVFNHGLTWVLATVVFLRLRVTPRTLISKVGQHTLYLLLSFVGISVALLFFSNQVVSTLRLYVFTLPLLLMIFLSVSVISIRSSFADSSISTVILSVVIIVSGLYGNLYGYNFASNTAYIDGSVRTGLQFARGELSYDTYLKRYRDHYMTLNEIKNELGLNERLYILTNYEVFDPAGVSFERDIDASYLRWDDMVFAGLEEQKSALQDEGLNYFVWGLDDSAFGVLSMSPLFSSEHIIKYFDIVMQRDNFLVLTWKDSQTPIDTDWAFVHNTSPILDTIRQQRKNSGIWRPLYRRLKFYYDYEQAHGEPYPVTESNLPPLPGAWY